MRSVWLEARWTSGKSMVVMIDLYQPSLAEKDLTLNFHRTGPVKINADAGLIHRMISNLFDNEVTHLPIGRSVTIDLRVEDSAIFLLKTMAQVSHPRSSSIYLSAERREGTRGATVLDWRLSMPSRERMVVLLLRPTARREGPGSPLVCRSPSISPGSRRGPKSPSDSESNRLIAFSATGA